MAALGSQMEKLLAAWDDATAPVDARVRENPLLFASASEIAAFTGVKRLKGPKSDETADTCRPWDHADFLARVGSFSIASWFAKPDVISAFECARHGWRNSAPDQLHCHCCKRFLCFRIAPKLSEAGALKVAETFAAQLVTGHTEFCPWRGNPSPEAFTTLPLATKRQVYETFMSRLNEEVERMLKDADFQTRISGLKIADEVVIKVLQEAGDSDVLSTAVLATKLLARCAQSAVSSEAIVNAAFLIATGWQFDEKHKPQMRVLWCESCNRHWQIFPDAIDGEDEQIEPPAKRAKVESPKAVDLLSQHRHFCPWVAGRKSTGVDNYGEIDQKLWEFVKLPGWRQYAQALIFLGDPAETAIISLDSGDLTPTRAHDPVQALESVRAVLEL